MATWDADDLARRILADVSTAVPGWTAQVEPLPTDAWDRTRTRLAAEGSVVPEWHPIAVWLRGPDGSDGMGLELWTDEDAGRDLANGLDQLQDVVVVATTERWPVCPDHGRQMVPVPDGDGAAWSCAGTDHAVPLGALRTVVDP